MRVIVIGEQQETKNRVIREICAKNTRNLVLTPIILRPYSNTQVNNFIHYARCDTGFRDGSLAWIWPMCHARQMHGF